MRWLNGESDIVQQAVTEASALFRNLTESGARKIGSPRALRLRSTRSKGLANIRELNELGSKVSADAVNVIDRRVSESFNKMRLFAKRQAAAE